MPAQEPAGRAGPAANPSGAEWAGGPLTVGLTGGIGAGKSAVARRLAGLGATVVDADVLAREAVAPGTPGLAAVLAAFGPGVVRPDGTLDRPALGARVFGDEAARATLERIIHPTVRARTAETIAAAPPGTVVVNDVPLLVETGLAPTYHLVVVVTASVSRRVERLASSRGMTPEEAHRRMRAQADDGHRRAAADVVLDNDGTPAALVAAVDALWRDRLRPYAANLLDGRVAAAPAGRAAYDPRWPAQAARLAARLRHVGAGLVTDVAHVGPTAVPGSPAADVLDLRVTVARADVPAMARRLPPAGFPAVAGGPGRHGSADPGRPALVAVTPT